MNKVDSQYLEMLQFILDNGTDKSDRTGTGTRSVFGYQMRFDLAKGFPLLTTKKIHTKSIVHELIWFIAGDTNIKYLQDNGVRIWDEWADANGDLGPVYGKQWRSWVIGAQVHPDDGSDFAGTVDYETMDQLANVVQRIKTNPDCRRLIVSAWNPADIPDMKLPPCHCLFQFNVANGKLNCQLYQRSADAFLGVPFNIASYALLTHMVAQVTGLEVGHFIHTFGDLHIYKNHMDQVQEQLTRSPMTLPTLSLDPSITNIDDFKYDHIKIENYVSYPAIKALVSV